MAHISTIERGYLAQGYSLPAGWTWDHVATQRARWGVGAIYVPVASAGGAVAWGVPIVSGRFLKHIPANPAGMQAGG